MKDIKELSCLAIRLGLVMPVEETGDNVRDALEAEMLRREALVADLRLDTRRWLVERAVEIVENVSVRGCVVYAALALPFRSEAMVYLLDGFAVLSDGMQEALERAWRGDYPSTGQELAMQHVETLWRVAVGEELVG